MGHLDMQYTQWTLIPYLCVAQFNFAMAGSLDVFWRIAESYALLQFINGIDGAFIKNCNNAYGGLVVPMCRSEISVSIENDCLAP